MKSLAKNTNATRAHAQKSSVKLVRIVEDLDTRDHFLELRFRHLTGEVRHLKIPRSQGEKAIYDALLNAGAKLPLDISNARNAISAAVRVEGVPIVAVTGRTGWHGDCFVLPDRTIGDHPNHLTYWDRSGAEPGEQRAGSIDGWKEGLRQACANSSYLTFAIAVAFAGPLIRKLNRRDGFFFNLAGESSTGKTLASRAARSVIGRADNTGIHTPSVKDRGLEELASRYNDLAIFLDDLGRLKGSKPKIQETLRSFAYGLAGGSGKIRSRVVRAELPNVTWVIAGLTSWETLLSEIQRAEGELVRLIDVPVPPRAEGGIFDLVSGGRRADDRKALAENVQKTVDAHYGRALPPYLKHLVDGKAALVDDANKRVDDFVKSATTDGNSLLARFAEKFGIVLAAATLAVDADVAPWTEQQARAAIRRVYFDALTVLVTPEQAADDFLKRLARRAKNKTRFPRVEPKSRFPKNLRKQFLGIRRTLPKIGLVVAVPRVKLRKMAGSPARRDAIVGELAKRDLFVKDSSGKSTIQLQVKGLSKKRRRYLVIPVKRLPKK